MKKTLLTALMLVCGIVFASAQAEIKFEKLAHDFGNFPESSPVVSCTFTFTNTGDKPLVINQAVASCGCTVPEYTKDPIQPGKKGEIKVVAHPHEVAPRTHAVFENNGGKINFWNVDYSNKDRVMVSNKLQTRLNNLQGQMKEIIRIF